MAFGGTVAGAGYAKPVEAVEKVTLHKEFRIWMDTKGTETAYRSARWPDTNPTT